MHTTSSSVTRLRCALLLALAVPALACASDADPDARENTFAAVDEEESVHGATAIRTFSFSPDPFERLLAANLLASPQAAALALGTSDAHVVRRTRDELVVSALRDAGDDVLVWWTAAMDCPAATRAVCDRDAAIERLRVIDGDNLSVWLDGLPQAAASSDTAPDAHAASLAIDQQLARAAQATRFDLHHIERIKRLWAAYERIEPHAGLRAAWPAAYDIPATANGIAFMMALGTALAHTAPPISPIMQACSPDALALSPARKDACKAIARIATERSDSMMGRQIGTSLGERVAHTDSERAAARSARLDFGWQTEAYTQLQSELEESGKAVDDYAARWSQPAVTEVSAVQSMLIDHGLPLEAPADWKPASRRWLHQREPSGQPSD